VTPDKNDGGVTPSISADAIADLAESGGLCTECGGVESAPASDSAPGRTSVLVAHSQGNAATSAFMRRVFAV
jgi:hypothetical protein